TFFQLEEGAFPTSPIDTGAVPADRGHEAVWLIDPAILDTEACTILIEWEQVAPGETAANGVQTLMRWETADGVWSRLRTGSTVIAQIRDAAGDLVFNNGAGT